MLIFEIQDVVTESFELHSHFPYAIPGMSYSISQTVEWIAPSFLKQRAITWQGCPTAGTSSSRRS